MVAPLPPVLSATVGSFGRALHILGVGLNLWAAAALLNQSSSASRGIPQHHFLTGRVLLSLLENMEH